MAASCRGALVAGKAGNVGSFNDGCLVGKDGLDLVGFFVGTGSLDQAFFTLSKSEEPKLGGLTVGRRVGAALRVARRVGLRVGRRVGAALRVGLRVGTDLTVGRRVGRRDGFLVGRSTLLVDKLGFLILFVGFGVGSFLFWGLRTFLAPMNLTSIGLMERGLGLSTQVAVIYTPQRMNRCNEAE